MRRLLFLSFVALFVSVVACAAPSSTPEECAPACPTDLTTPTSQPAAKPSPSEMVPRITIAEVWQKMENKADILIVDNRHKEEYDVDRIRGAVLAPLDTIVAGAWTLPLEKELILY